jgi:hypothetical protein
MSQGACKQAQELRRPRPVLGDPFKIKRFLLAL